MRSSILLSICFCSFIHASRLCAQTLTDSEDAPGYASLEASLDGIRIDVRTASRSDLAAFPLIGPEAADRLIAYRNSGRHITDLDDLADAMNVDPERAEMLAS